MASLVSTNITLNITSRDNILWIDKWSPIPFLYTPCLLFNRMHYNAMLLKNYLRVLVRYVKANVFLPSDELYLTVLLYFSSEIFILLTTNEKHTYLLINILKSSLEHDSNFQIFNASHLSSNISINTCYCSVLKDHF